MKDILELIEQKKKVYSQSAFFKFLQDETIDPSERLAFAPCAAPFIMSFADLCKYVLRQEPTNDKIQSILNQHTYEDESHWRWFLEDLDTLGFNSLLPLNDCLRFFWGKETQASRLLTYQLYAYIAQSEPIEKLVVLEAMEAASDVFMSNTKPVATLLQSITNREYQYFGERHFEAEMSHNTHSHSVNNFLKNIYLSEKTLQKNCDLVNQVFELFTQWNARLLEYVLNCQVSTQSDRACVIY